MLWICSYSVVGLLLFIGIIFPAHATPMILKDHPLVEKIWLIKEKKFIETSTLVDQVQRSYFVLLGETHDNPVHHQHQAELISALTHGERKPAIVFEMLNLQQIKSIEGRQLDSADNFFGLTKWEETGWPSGELYRPVVDAVIAAKLPVFAGSFDRSTISKIVTKGEEFIPQDVKLDLDNMTFSKGQQDELAKEIEHTHCNMLPENMYKGMMLGQRTKDVLMAMQLMKHASKKHGALLVAGSGHARTDRGVPAYIRHKQPQMTIFSVAWMEVDEEGKNPSDYAQGWGTESLPFDAVWFTAKVERPDPCEELKKYTKHHKKHKPESSAEQKPEE